jgi:WD40 repeat protein
VGRQVRRVASHEGPVGFRKQGQYDEILGSKDRELHLYPVGFLSLPLTRVATVLIQLQRHYHKNTIQALAWSPNGNMVASASRDQTVRVFDIRAMREVQTLRGHKKEVCCTCRVLLSFRI